MHRFVKFGLSLGSVFCLLTGPAPAWAQADDSESTITSSGTGRQSSVVEWNMDTFAANPVSSFRGSGQSTDNVFGSTTCHSAGTTLYLGPAEPPAADSEGVCDPASASIAAYGSYNYSYTDCLAEDMDLTFTFGLPDTSITCAPFSCFEEPLTTDAGATYWPLKVGCTYPAFYTLTTMSDIGMATIETVEIITVEEAEYDPVSGRAMVRTSSTSTGVSTTTLTDPEVELPANAAFIEVPGEGSTMSGIGIISGWSCLGGELAAELRNADGAVLATVPLGSGTSREDTEPVCGDTLNGFSTTMNWNLLPAGAASIHLIQNGEEVASNNFSAVALGVEFLVGMWTTTVQDFPTIGQSATLEWQNFQQGFVISEID